MKLFSYHSSLRFAAAFLAAAILVGIAAPAVQAKTVSKSDPEPTKKLEYAGWIPYWSGERGINDAHAHLSQFTEINPFGYTVKSDGTLYDAMNVQSPAWQRLFKDARKQDVKVIPTIMWSDGAHINTILSNPKTRAAHIKAIVRTVDQNDYDGVDIDYEGKYAETKDAYASFLKELSIALKKENKHAQLDCTIEARMPLSARYSGTPPANIEYANDLPKINRYCDRVRLMTYDQTTADIQLNAAHSGELYDPIADPKWVEKVVNYMAQDIDRSKLSVGVATYGYIYQAMTKPGGNGFTYMTIEAFNPQYGIDTAKQYGLTPKRSPAGELSFSYVPKEQTNALPTNSFLSAFAPRGTASAFLAALGALKYTKQQSRQAPVQYLTWNDAGSIKQKVDLAKKLGVRGVAIFKIDGGEDPQMWSVLK